MNVDKIHIRHVILFLFNSGKNTFEAKEMISQAYGDNIVSLSTIKIGISDSGKVIFHWRTSKEVVDPKKP